MKAHNMRYLMLLVLHLTIKTDDSFCILNLDKDHNVIELTKNILLRSEQMHLIECKDKHSVEKTNEKYFMVQCLDGTLKNQKKCVGVEKNNDYWLYIVFFSALGFFLSKGFVKIHESYMKLPKEGIKKLKYNILIYVLAVQNLTTFTTFFLLGEIWTNRLGKKTYLILHFIINVPTVLISFAIPTLLSKYGTSRAIYLDLFFSLTASLYWILTMFVAEMNKTVATIMVVFSLCCCQSFTAISSTAIIDTAVGYSEMTVQLVFVGLASANMVFAILSISFDFLLAKFDEAITSYAIIASNILFVIICFFLVNKLPNIKSSPEKNVDQKKGNCLSRIAKVFGEFNTGTKEYRGYFSGVYCMFFFLFTVFPGFLIRFGMPKWTILCFGIFETIARAINTVYGEYTTKILSEEVILFYAFLECVLCLSAFPLYYGYQIYTEHQGYFFVASAILYCLIGFGLGLLANAFGGIIFKKRENTAVKSAMFNFVLTFGILTGSIAGYLVDDNWPIKLKD